MKGSSLLQLGLWPVNLSLGWPLLVWYASESIKSRHRDAKYQIPRGRYKYMLVVTIICSGRHRHALSVLGTD
ncbi:hypothetical protein DER45DRAFT_179803 [Fusarium avenaceum]|nr:hypothetical protein DER45DRAFT_179803 [Fusarium avenaceum]